MKFRALRYTLLLIALFSITLLLRASLPTVATGTWVAAGNLSAARSGACTVALSDGRLLISGGGDVNGPTTTADLFSTTGSWSAAASMNSPRSHQSCAVLQDGRVLVAGGTTSGGGITNSAEIYDPSADSWAQAGVMNDARSGATASVLQDGRVLIAGGQSSDGALNTLEIFDPNSGNFSNAGTMSSPRQDHAAAVLSDGRVLIAGGSSDGTNALATTDTYDPQAGSVSAGPAMSTPRAKHTATMLLDGTVVVIGGTDGTNDLASVEFFDPAANNFNAASSLTTARSKHSAFLLPNNNEVLVVGGQSAGTGLASAELYIPWQKAFQATGAMATPRSDATGGALTKVDGRLLIAGGSSASAELYGFATVKTDAADYPPGTTVTITGSGWQPGETVTLTLVESPLIDTHGPFTTVADTFGNISNNSFVTDIHDLSIRFYLTAAGSQSQAQNTFTDAVTVNTSVASNNNPSVVGQSVTLTATAVQQGNSSPITCGSIQFKDGAANLGSAVVLNGVLNQVSITTAALTQGTHTIVGVYSPASACSTNNNGTDTSLTQLVAGAATKLAFVQQPSNTSAAQSISPAVTVTVEDVNGTRVNNSTASITMAIGTNPGGGTLGGATTVSAVSGTATFSNLSINKTGTGYTLSATSSGLGSATSSTFNITPGAATHLAFSQQPTNTAAGASISPAVTAQVLDANSNVVTTGTGSTASITVAIGTNPGGGTLSGTKTVNAVSGVATFSGLFIDKTGTGYTLTAASTGLTGATSSTFNITPGTASKLVFSQQPTNTTAAQTITPAMTVQVQDADSNLVTTSTASITVAIGTNPGGGTLSGTLTQSAVGGVATFGNLSLNKAGTGYTLTASSTGLTGATSSTFNITAGAAAQLAFSQQPTNTVAGVSITPAITVQVQDANGNLVTTSTASIVVAIGTNPSGGTLSGTKTVSASAGIATFGNLSIDKVGTGYTLSASSTGLTSATSGAFTITPASATKFVVTGSGTQTAGTGNTLTITAVDNFGNTDTTFGPNLSLMFSGANPSPDPATSPTATNKNNQPIAFGTGTPVTFTNGVTTSVMTLYKAETASIVVSDGPSITTPGTLTVVVSTAAANKLAVSGSTANLSSGSTRALTATVEDAFGNTITSDTRSVTFAQTAGTGSVTGLGSSNAVAGVASLTVTGDLAGTVTITASASGLAAGTGNPITFSVIAGAAAKLVLSGATADLASGSTRTLTATIQDAVGNTVNTGADSTISITFAKTSGTGTVTGLGSSNAVAGVATVTVTGALAGSITIAASGTASTGALTASTGNPITFNVVAGPAAKLALSGSTADLASGSTRQLTATIQDAGGNTVSTGPDSTVSISFAKAAGTGTVTGLGSSNAVAGVATLTVTGNLAGSATITASGTASTGSLAAGAGNPITFNVIAGATAKLAFAQQPADTTAGQTISVVTVQILDANGNLTGSTASVAMALTGSPAGVTLSGTLTKAAVSGVATFNDLSINKGGTYTLSAASSGLTGATSASFTINNPAPTLTSIAPTSGNLTQSLNVVFTGTNFISGVSSVNFGSDITVNTTSVDSATQITANIAIASTAATGPRNVSVTNSTPGGGTSATQTFTVINPATTTQVVSSLNSSTFGQAVTFTAKVSSDAGTPTGSVIFYDGACGVNALAGSVSLDGSGQATFSTASLNAGTHNISACYTPSGIFQSSSGSVSQVVNQATPIVSFTGAPASAYFNSQFMVSASTNASTTPAITASGSCIILGTTVTMTSGTGTCSLLASWAADTNYFAATATQSTSALQLPVSVTVPDTTVTYDGVPKAVIPTVAPAVAYAVTYTGVSPTVYGPSTSAPTEPGSYSVVATVTDPNYVGSGSGALTISQKDPALVLTLLTGMPEPSTYGTRVYFELTTANSPCPTGQVQFFVDSDSQPSATVALTSTTCVKPVEFSTATLMPGTHSVYAVYGGDTYYVNKASAAVSHDVIADGTTVTLATSAMMVYVGDPVTLTATVTPSNTIDGSATVPSGKVQFYDGTSLLGESTLSSNTATFTVQSLPAGSHSITATYVSANGDFAGSSSPVSVETVDKITPTITWANPADIVYGTKLSATQLNGTATDTHNGGITINGTFTYNPAADAVLAVGSRNLTVTFTPDDTATYGNQTASATINVTPATLTVTADDASRPYGADNPTFTSQYSGFVNSEGSGIVTTAPTCNTTADSSSNVGTYAITCSGGVATNYTIKYVDGRLTINPAPLTVTAADAGRLYGDPNPSFTGTITGIKNSDNITATYASAATAASAIGTYPIIPTLVDPGNKLGNYIVTSNNGKLTINPAPLTVTAADASRLYGDPNPSFTGTITGIKNSDNITATYASAATAASAIGNYPIVPTLVDPGNKLGNYIVTSNNGKLTIDPAPLTVTAADAGRLYGDANPSFTGTITGIKNSDNITATYASAATAASAIGNYPIVPTLVDPGNKLGNYLITSNNGTLTVKPAPLSVVVDAKTKIYGDSNPTLTGTLSGVKNSDNITASYSTTATPASYVGQYDITATLNDPDNKLGNYSLTNTPAKLSITPASLSVTPGDASRMYGDLNPVFTGTITGIKNNDNITANYSTTATMASPVGAYYIAATLNDPDSKLGNYTVTLNNGKLTITQAPLAVVVDAKTKIYGDSNPTLTGTLAGVKNSDNITPSYSTTATAASPVAQYDVLATLNDPDNKLGNYSVTNAPAKLSITPASLSVTPADASRLYGDPNPVFTGTITGIKNGDNITASYSTVATPASAIGPYAITATLSDPASKLGNYKVTLNSGTLTVNPAPLTITPANASRLYGSANPAFTGTIVGIKNGDPITPIYATTATPSSNIGPYDITATLSDPGNKLGNYAVALNKGTLTINPAPLTIKADSKTKFLNAANPPLTATYSGFVLGQGPSSLSGTLTCTTTATTNSPVGSYTINCSGQTSTNYAITYVSSTLTITYLTSGMCAGDAGHQIRQPINVDGSSVFKMGSTVPTKFAVCDANGASIGTTGVVTGYGLVAAASSPSITVDEDIYSTTPDTAFRWDPTGQQWIFNQSTKNNGTLNKTGVIYFFTINLNDGSSIFFQYGLK